MIWAAIALAAQVLAARGHGRRDYSRPAGSPARGLIYNFTIAMMPGHKESIRLHPVAFLVGLVMHAGVMCSLVAVVVLLIDPDSGARLAAFLRAPAAIALAAGAVLLLRRTVTARLRNFSTPDDFLACLAVCGLLALMTLPLPDDRSRLRLLLYSALLFIYLPLSKLKHAVFFFVARGDYGRRLGYRGVYPPAAQESE
jgi:hypothetical protein